MTARYERPVRELLQIALGDMSDPFTSADMVLWFQSRYDKVSPNTVRSHLGFASVNVPTGTADRHWRDEDRTIYRLSRGQFTRYRPEIHGLFENGFPLGLAEETEDNDLGDDPADDEGAAFALELHLEEFMEANWESIDFGRPLRIWTNEDGEWGRQYGTEVGIIDFLCEDDATDEMVVVELKRGKSSDQVIGQALRYMGWVREHLANGRGVKGIVITHEYDDRVRYAVAELPNVEAWTYSVSFTLDTRAFAS